MNKLTPALAIIASFAAFLAGCGSPSPHEQLQAAGEMFQSGDRTGAIELVKSLKETELDEQVYGEARLVLGTFYVLTKDLVEARKEYREVYDRFGAENPNPMLAQLAQAAIGSLVGEALEGGEAQRALDIALETSGTQTMVTPFSRELTLKVSEALYKLERYDESLEHLEYLARTERDPQSAMNLKLQIATILAVQGKDDEAFRLLLEDVEKQDDPEMLAEGLMQATNTIYPQGIEMSDEQLERRAEKLGRAINIYQKLVDEAPDDPSRQAELLLRQSIPLWMDEKKRESIDLLRQVVEMEGSAPKTKAMAMIGLAECHLDLDETEEAAEMLNKVKERYAGSEFALRADQGLAYIDSQKAADLAVESIVEPAQNRPESQPAASQPESAPAPEAE